MKVGRPRKEKTLTKSFRVNERAILYLKKNKVKLNKEVNEFLILKAEKLGLKKLK